MKRIPVSDGSTWPCPDGFALEEAEDGVEWNLRYGDHAKVRYQAAELINAYGSLIFATRAKRERVVREIRRALEKP